VPQIRDYPSIVIGAILVYFYIKTVNMSRQSISLTEPNNEWLNSLVESKEYSSKSEIVNDLIRKVRESAKEVEFIRMKLALAEKSGFTNESAAEILAESKRRMNG